MTSGKIKEKEFTDPQGASADALKAEAASIKRKLKRWTREFEKRNGRKPTSEDKKASG